MLILCAVQALIAAAFLLTGLIVLFGIGITGLLFLVPAALFAAAAGATLNRSRGAVLLALSLDAVLAWFAAIKIRDQLDPAVLIARFGAEAAASMATKPMDFVVPALALALVGVAAVAVIMDWRELRASPWF